MRVAPDAGIVLRDEVPESRARRHVDEEDLSGALGPGRELAVRRERDNAPGVRGIADRVGPSETAERALGKIARALATGVAREDSRHDEEAGDDSDDPGRSHGFTPAGMSG